MCIRDSPSTGRRGGRSIRGGFAPGAFGGLASGAGGPLMPVSGRCSERALALRPPSTASAFF
eukprot:1761977-Alexandrium_andersonii.AAC.1